MKSQATWLEFGDQNTKFFQNFSNHRKRINTIWEMTNTEGNKVRGFKELADLGIQHFKGIFEEPTSANIGEILRVISLFPRLVNEEDNERMFMSVTKEELLYVLSTFKKDRSLGLDGWTVEFFLDFFDLLGEDLLQVVEEVRRSRKVPVNINTTFIALILQGGLP
jgi:hypothetical protein